MTNKWIAGSGGLCLLLLCIIIKGWWFPGQKEMPAFFDEQSKCLISLGEGFAVQGVRQIDDACLWADVIELTATGDSHNWLAKHPPAAFPVPGEHFEFDPKTPLKHALLRSWMPAGQRISLGILLHPDRMTEADWEVLPGIGPQLASRIEKNRQINGDFERFENLSRVKGIGKGRLERWKAFFIDM